MRLIERFEADLKVAMRMKDGPTKEVLRDLITEIRLEEKKNKELVSDERTIEILKSHAKKSREALEMFIQGDRGDLEDLEVCRIRAIEKYLPQQLNQGQIYDIIETKIKELSIDVTNKGMLLKHLMPLFKDQTNGAEIKSIVETFWQKK